MISGGNVTVVVSDMDAAVDFYTNVLAMKLTNRFGNHWATVDAGRGLVIGLHPSSAKYPAPGTKGSMMIGLEIDEPIEAVVDRLQRRGVRFNGSIVKDGTGELRESRRSRWQCDLFMGSQPGSHSRSRACRCGRSSAAMTARQFRRFALGLPEVEERAHMGHPDFRVGGKIFATLSYPDKSTGMLKPHAGAATDLRSGPS